MEIEDALKELESVTNVRFARLVHIAQHFFGEPRVKGSHHIFRTPWLGKPLLNIQGEKGKGKSQTLSSKTSKTCTEKVN